MADYKEQTVSGTSWQRAWQITMANTLGGLPSVTYNEEKVINLDDGQIRQMLGSINYTIDPEGVIELRDIETLQKTGETIPVATVHQALFSDYIDRAIARDDGANLVAPVEPEEPTL